LYESNVYNHQVVALRINQSDALKFYYEKSLEKGYILANSAKIWSLNRFGSAMADLLPSSGKS
jgi:hypothetical protein